MAAESVERVGAFSIHSEAHGPHWIAWVSRQGEAKPLGSIVQVGETRAEAEERARSWAERLAKTTS